MSDSDVISPSAPPASEARSDMLDASSSSTSGPSWQDQDVLLRELWTQNKTPQQISDVLHRSIAAIMTRAARLGLPRRAAPGRKPGSRRAVAPNGEAPLTMPRPASNKSPESEKGVQTSPRICLMCLRSFASLGRHNRICNTCKSSSEYESAVALADINIPV